MARIKGWDVFRKKLVTDQGPEKAWVSKRRSASDDRTYLSVYKSLPGPYRAVASNDKGNVELYTGSSWDEAHKKAVEYMRSHPNG